MTYLLIYFSINININDLMTYLLVFLININVNDLMTYLLIVFLNNIKPLLLARYN